MDEIKESTKPNTSKLSLQYYKVTNVIFHILFFTVSLQNLMCVLHLWHISVGTSYFSNTQ